MRGARVRPGALDLFGRGLIAGILLAVGRVPGRGVLLRRRSACPSEGLSSPGLGSGVWSGQVIRLIFLGLPSFEGVRLALAAGVLDVEG